MALRDDEASSSTEEFEALSHWLESAWIRRIRNWAYYSISEKAKIIGSAIFFIGIIGFFLTLIVKSFVYYRDHKDKLNSIIDHHDLANEMAAAGIAGLSLFAASAVILVIMYSLFKLYLAISARTRTRNWAFEFGRSGDTIIDKFIFKKRLKWIPYNKFNNVEYLDEGGFSTIYKANLPDAKYAGIVVLKCFKNLDENLNEIFNECKYYHHQSKIIFYYGFTKNPDTSNYILVMSYANGGNLRKNLSEIVKNNWKQKLRMLCEIITGLNEIHRQKLIHCDLHDGNILYHKMGNESKVIISDLGLCKPTKSLKKEDIYGVIPFMAPEVLRHKSYTPASDIYSFSMIMWEFTSGVPPFNNRAHNIQLSLSICEGERPEIIENTPQCYVDLMKKCWNEDPLKRPSSREIYKIIYEWIFLPSYKKIKDINEELKSNIMEFINAPIGDSNIITEPHPQAYYTSRLHNFTSEELIEGESLKSLEIEVIEVED